MLRTFALLILFGIANALAAGQSDSELLEAKLDHAKIWGDENLRALRIHHYLSPETVDSRNGKSLTVIRDPHNIQGGMPAALIRLSLNENGTAQILIHYAYVPNSPWNRNSDGLSCAHEILSLDMAETASLLEGMPSSFQWRQEQLNESCSHCYEWNMFAVSDNKTERYHRVILRERDPTLAGELAAIQSAWVPNSGSIEELALRLNNLVNNRFELSCTAGNDQTVIAQDMAIETLIMDLYDQQSGN